MRTRRGGIVQDPITPAAPSPFPKARLHFQPTGRTKGPWCCSAPAQPGRCREPAFLDLPSIGMAGHHMQETWGRRALTTTTPSLLRTHSRLALWTLLHGTKPSPPMCTSEQDQALPLCCVFSHHLCSAEHLQSVKTTAFAELTTP